CGVELRREPLDHLHARHTVRAAADRGGVEAALDRPFAPDALDRLAAVDEHAVEVGQDSGERHRAPAGAVAAARRPAASASAARPPSSVTASPEMHSRPSAAGSEVASARIPISGGPTMKPV